LGNRILEVAQDEERVERRDPTAGFLAWVPKGSLAKGKELVENGGGGKTMACALCHGPGLKGLGDIPPLAGRSPVYIGRQMFAIQNGARYGGNNELMKPVVEKLTEEDVVSISAYVASLTP
jgi:cytochrome c553